MFFCSNIGTAQNYSSNKKNNAMTFEMSGYCSAHVLSGNYGGSTQFEIFPSVYYYTYFDATLEKNQDFKAEFQSLINIYISEITVNNSVTLKEYLTYLYHNDTIKINEVHRKNDSKRPVGSSREELSTLFFVDDNTRVLSVSPYFVVLNWNEATTNLNRFLQNHAFHYESKMKNEFLKSHYYKYD